MTKNVLTILIIFLQLFVNAQEIVRQDSYYNVKKGIYETKSLVGEMITIKTPVIAPQTKFIEDKKTAFIKIETDSIALFNKINDQGNNKPIGVLKKTSIIQIDTIFYREIYKDTTKEWAITFNVWYSIRINDKQYYTDYQIHDFLAYKIRIEELEQYFLLIAQSTGFDYHYDVGYPNKFFVMILDNNKETFFTSHIFDYNYADEFLIQELDYITLEIENEGLTFTIHGALDKFIGKWTGKELIID